MYISAKFFIGPERVTSCDDSKENRSIYFLTYFNFALKTLGGICPTVDIFWLTMMKLHHYGGRSKECRDIKALSRLSATVTMSSSPTLRRPVKVTTR